MFRDFAPARSDLRGLIRLAIPIVTSQLGVMLMGVVDTIVVGRVSARELAAASIGQLYFFAMAVFGFGILSALDPILSQALGARDRDAATLAIQRAAILALGMGTIATLLCAGAEPVFRLLRQPDDVIPRAARFVWMSAPGMLPMMLWATNRLALQSMKRTREIVITILAGNVLNLALNWIFVFGHLGSPAMGAVGSALSSTIGRFVSFGLLLGMTWRTIGPHLRPWRRESFERAAMLRTIRLGLPIGVHVSIEYSTFGSISFFAGWFGAESLAGHQVAINLASFMYMVPMGLASAAAVLVGHAIGAGDAPHARRVAGSALACGALFMAGSAAAFLVAPGMFARAFTSVPAVITVASALIPIAGFFQVFDGIQVVCAGVLRGAGDTRAPMLANLLGFWLFGMPVSLALGFGVRLGVVGLWWGFVAGLFAVAAFLLFRVRRRLSGEITRVAVGPSSRTGIG